DCSRCSRTSGVAASRRRTARRAAKIGLTRKLHEPQVRARHRLDEESLLPEPSDDNSSSDVMRRLSAALEGRYAVERELGRGGMAAVFLARDVKHDREVAIKVLHPELAASVG